MNKLPTMPLIVSLDPGGTTGVAYYRLPPKRAAKPMPNSMNLDFVERIDGLELGPDHHHKELWSYLADLNPDVVICERFDNDGNPAALLISVEYIAVARLYCQLTKKPFILRSRGFKDVEWLKDMKLKKLGFYVEGKPHRNDATRHLIHYVVCDLKRKGVLERIKKK